MAVVTPTLSTQYITIRTTMARQYGVTTVKIKLTDPCNDQVKSERFSSRRLIFFFLTSNDVHINCTYSTVHVSTRTTNGDHAHNCVSIIISLCLYYCQRGNTSSGGSGNDDFILPKKQTIKSIFIVPQLTFSLQSASSTHHDDTCELPFVVSFFVECKFYKIILNLKQSSNTNGK